MKNQSAAAVMEASKNASLSFHNILGKHLTQKKEGSRVCSKIWGCGCTDVLLAPGCPPISSPNEVRNRGLKVTASLPSSSSVRLWPVIQTLIFFDSFCTICGSCCQKGLSKYTRQISGQQYLKKSSISHLPYRVSEGSERMCCVQTFSTRQRQQRAQQTNPQLL